MPISTVLIIDDEADARNVLRRMLELFCPEVQIILEAPNSSEALRLARQQVIDLALIDIELRGENGLELGQQLTPLCRKLAFVTAHERWDGSMQESTIPFLFKPVLPDMLQQLVSEDT